MKNNTTITSLTLLLLSFLSTSIYAQDDLMNMLEGEEEEKTELIRATFKGSRLINGHSIETRKKKELEFLISHRFGELNSGGYDFFGLDNANIRLGLEYGINDRLNVGIGRSSFEKTYDGFVKYKILRQSSGTKSTPISLVYFGSAAYKALKTTFGQPELTTANRLTYTHQLLIARKFSPAFSFQIMPTLIHRNATTSELDDNEIFALGFGGRLKLSNRVSLNAEYYYQANPDESRETYNSIAIGFDIETGGHVFQLHLTNSQAMVEKGFISETLGDFSDGGVHFGFNISRVFTLGN